MKAFQSNVTRPTAFLSPASLVVYPDLFCLNSLFHCSTVAML
jgi:hypothetical protein